MKTGDRFSFRIPIVSGREFRMSGMDKKNRWLYIKNSLNQRR